jgi:hypothetical protein
MKRMSRRESFTEIKWIVPENSPDPPLELKRLFIQAAEPPRQEEAQRGPYTEDDVEFILTSIRFGKQLKEEVLKEIKVVVQARIAAFSRDDAEMGYTTLIECEIDPLDKTPVQIRPYKLAFQIDEIQTADELLHTEDSCVVLVRKSRERLPKLSSNF